MIFTSLSSFKGISNLTAMSLLLILKILSATVRGITRWRLGIVGVFGRDGVIGTGLAAVRGRIAVPGREPQLYF